MDRLLIIMFLFFSANCNAQYTEAVLFKQPCAVPAIAGTLTVNAGSTTSLSDAATGGAWASSVTSTAIVGNSTGVVTGVAAGTSMITYTMSLGCYAITTVTVHNAAPAYATLNPSDITSGLTLSGGNLTIDMVGFTSPNGGCRTTVGVSSGKYYIELKQNSSFNGSDMIGVCSGAADMTALGQDANSWVINGQYAYLGVNHSGGFNGSGFSNYTTGDVNGLAIDADAKTLQFYLNNSPNGALITGLPSTIYVVVGQNNLGFLANGCNWTTNFGATTLTYSPPAGFNAGLY